MGTKRQSCWKKRADAILSRSFGSIPGMASCSASSIARGPVASARRAAGETSVGWRSLSACIVDVDRSTWKAVKSVSVCRAIGVWWVAVTAWRPSKRRTCIAGRMNSGASSQR